MSRQGNLLVRTSRGSVRASFWAGLWCALSLPVCAQSQPATPASAPAQTATATADELTRRANDVRIAVQLACEQRTDLHGAWIYNLRLDPNRPGYWMVDLIVDSASAQNQRQIINGLLKNELQIGSQTSLPFGPLLAALRSRLESRFGK